jgi:hypothetical protein
VKPSPSMGGLGGGEGHAGRSEAKQENWMTRSRHRKLGSPGGITPTLTRPIKGAGTH